MTGYKGLGVLLRSRDKESHWIRIFAGWIKVRVDVAVFVVVVCCGGFCVVLFGCIFIVLVL